MTMPTKKYYRVDRRDVVENDELSPESDYQSGFNNIGKQAEEILERRRATEFPTKPPRAASFFVTDDFDCAKRYWHTHDRRYVYEVEVDEQKILHRADMHWVDAIGDELKRAILGEADYGKCDELARRYWRSEETANPCWEYLLEKVTVGKRLKGLSNLKEYVASQVSKPDLRYDVNDDELPHFVQPKPKGRKGRMMLPTKGAPLDIRVSY
jgi:hypothetical protein